VIQRFGIGGSQQFAYHRTPGFGGSNWVDIISELRCGGFQGCIDIEGWHDPVYRNELEITGLVHGLNYLK
jgi:sugar phosphate isomerase/epimerase